MIRQGLFYLAPAESWNRSVADRYGVSLLDALPFDILMKIRDPALAEYM